MKKILPWLKSNLIVVIALAVALIAAPVMLFFSSGWASKVYADAESRIQQKVQQVQGLDVSYTIEPYMKGMEAVNFKAPPNEPTTTAMKALQDRIIDEVGKVREEAIEFNSRGKTLLIGGETEADRLFPSQPNESTRFRLLDQFAELWPRAHARLLERYRAGQPPSDEAVLSQLQKLREQEVARITAGRADQKLTPDEEKQVAELLGTRRLQVYRSAARSVSFYADPSVFVAVTPWPRNQIMPLEEAWERQMLYWVHEEIVRAIANANSDSAGNWLPVFEGPFKIIESISVSPSGVLSAEPQAPAGYGSEPAPDAGNAPASDDDKSELAPDYSLTLTGRASWPTAQNPVYDIRYVDIVAIVASRDIPRIIEAFPATNFMTVVDVDITDYDPLKDIRLGYDMGSEHLVRARFKVETAWLRPWIKPHMPDTVRERLGVPLDAPAGGSGEPVEEDDGSE